MFLRNIFLKTLRDQRTAILCWGGILFLFTVFVTSVYGGIFSGPDKARLIADSQLLAQSPLYPGGGNPTDLDTFGGYITLRFLGIMPVIFGIYTLLAGTGLTRGEEEKGNFDLLLSTPYSRRSVLWQKWAGLLVATVAIAVLTWLGLLVGTALPNIGLDAVAAGLTCLNFVACALVFGSVGMLFGQLTITRKGAYSAAGGVLIATFFLDNLAAQTKALAWLHYFSPFFYHNQSKPLAVSVGLNLGAFGLLLAVSVIILVATIFLFERRDIGNIFPLFKTKRKLAIPNPYRVAEPRSLWLRNSFTFWLRTGLAGAFYWSILPSLYLVLGVSVFESAKSELLNLLKSDLYQALGYVAISTNENLLGLLIQVDLVTLIVYAVVQVAGWTGEETQGRLELLLSTPQPRWRLLVVRYGVASIHLAVCIGTVGLVFWSAAGATGIEVSGEKTLATFFTAWVVCVTIAGVGFSLTAYGPGWSIGATGGLVIASYLLNVLGKSLKLPDWIVNFSIFEQYGNPMVGGANWPSLGIMLALSAVFILLAIRQFRQRDLVK